MTNRDLFHATMRRENGEDLLHMEQGFNIGYDSWIEQGLPSHIADARLGKASIDPTPDLYDYFNVAGYLECTFDQFCVPAFEEQTIEETPGRRMYIDEKGTTLKERTDGVESPPFEVDFTFKTPADYQEHRHRFIGNIDKRVDRAWLETNGPRFIEQKDHPVTLRVWGPFAFLRGFLGVENAMVLPYTEPDMIRLMLEDHLETSMAAAVPVIEACKPDMSYVWEDCCGSTGPFIAPNIFEEIMAPWYRSWKDFLSSMGIEWIMLDTDGNPAPLVRQWYEAGVDCLQPWEVNAIDMLKFADEFPEYVMMGGIYKHMFEPGDMAQAGRFGSGDVHKAIDDELERVVKPMAKRGGYIASLDHWAFWGTTYDGYGHYSKGLERYGKANRVTRVKMS